MNSKYKRLIGDIAIFALGALGSKLIAFLLMPLYTNVLSDAEYGIADLVFSLGQLILPFISLAIFNGLLRFGLMRDKKPEDALRCATYVFVGGSIVAVLITPLFSVFPSFGEWRWYLCLYVVSSFAVSNSLVYLKVKDKNKQYAFMSILQSLSLVICNVIFLIIFRRGIQGYLISYIVSNCITAGTSFVIGHMWKDLMRSTYNSSLMKSMVIFSLPYILNDVSWWAIHSANKLLVEFVLGSAILGLFTTASKIPSLINALASIFTQAWGLSSIKEYDSTNDTSFYSKVFGYFLVFVFGGCIVVVSLIKPFMSFYVGDEFFSSWHYVPLLLLGAVFSAIASFMGSLLGAMKKSQNLMTSTLIASIVDVLFSLVFVRLIGIWGAVIGTLIAYVIVAMVRMRVVKKNIKMDFNLKKFIPLSTVALIQAVLVGCDVYPIITSIVSVVIYILLVWKDIINIYMGMFKRKKV